MERKNILAFAGTDARSLSMKRSLEREGYHIVDIEDSPRATATVLPMPYSADGIHIKDTDMTIDSLLCGLGVRYPVLGGRFDWNAYGAALRYGVRLFDYYENESAQIENAHLTAQAAIALASEYGISLLGERVLVCGYGRIGKILCRLLSGAGAYVYAAARRNEDIAWINVSGYKSVRYSSLEKDAAGIRLIINTVPFKIFTSDILASFGEGALILELASVPCCDKNEAETLGIRYIRAAALPGRYYPDAAGDILARSAVEIMKKEGLQI